MIKYQEFIKVMGYLAALYPRFELTEATIDAYYTVLRDLDAILLKRAAESVGANSTFFPAAAELRKAAFDIQATAQGIPSPAEAWSEVMRELSRVGSWEWPKFSNKMIYKAVDSLGGWNMLCMSNNNVADRAHFLKIYAEFLRRHEQDAAMLPEIREMIEKLSARMGAPQLEEGHGQEAHD